MKRLLSLIFLSCCLAGTTQSIAAEPTKPTSKKEKETFKVDGVTFNMIKVEGGTFTMGATPEQDVYTCENNTPAHQVTLSTFYIGETEVTQALWEVVMGENPSRKKGKNFPVENVNWYDCEIFIKKLNVLTGAKFCFPTEAQWEFAARGGNYSKGYQYSGSNILDKIAWYGDNGRKGRHAIRKKRPNELGIYDMSGNMWEWCGDWKEDYSPAPVTDPTGAVSGTTKVLRGGSRFTHKRCCRTSARNADNPQKRSLYYGLRLALEP